MSENNDNQMDIDDKKPVADVEETKQFYRRKVWSYLESKRLSDYPRPVYGRIPNFKQSELSAKMLLELEEFCNAKYIEINPDKPQETARLIALQNDKQLFVPIPRLKDGFLKHITKGESVTDEELKRIVNRKGLEANGTVVASNIPLINLLVVGSVAVSKIGQRIGKGRGYADLEFAILSDLKAVDESTVIVTNVHDSQVFDYIPSKMFEPHDVPVDIILTPTQIIRIDKRLPRHHGIFWNLISSRKLKLMPILQVLKEVHEKNGENINLKEDTDVENYEHKSRKPRLRKFSKRIRRTKSESNDSKEETKSAKPKTRQRKVTNGENGNTITTEKPSDQKPKKSFRRNKQPTDFSLMLGNIERNLRVRQLKDALNKEGIKPRDITWRGYRGFCFLHYAKPKKVEEKAPLVVENVVQILKNLKINPDSNSQFQVKVVEPISRIETANITAV